MKYFEKNLCDEMDTVDLIDEFGRTGNAIVTNAFISAEDAETEQEAVTSCRALYAHIAVCEAMLGRYSEENRSTALKHVGMAVDKDASKRKHDAVVQLLAALKF